MIKTKWDLTRLYKSENDPQIERDVKKAEKAYEDFAAKYAGRTDYLEDEDMLIEAMDNFEHLRTALIAKPSMYFHYRHDLDSRDSVAEAKLNLLSVRLTKTVNKITFFPIAISRIAPDLQKKYLASPKLAHYRYMLKCSFEEGKYLLSEAEEKLMHLKGLPAHALWVRGNEKILTKQALKWGGKNVPMQEAINMVKDLPTKQRRQLGAMISERMHDISDFAEAELNAVVIDKKISDELRGYEKPYSATVLSYQNEPAVVENLVKMVTKNFPLAHRFYKLKARMLGLKSLTYHDRAARIGRPKKKIPFSEAVAITRRAFTKVNPEYAKIFDQFLERGQIDVLPKMGKHGGAYCSSYEDLPTYVLLNHLPNLDSLGVLGHEMGHAIHYIFTLKNQPPLYRDYSTTTTEVASTLFENFVFEEVFPTLPKQEQIWAMHDRINDSVQTIFRQIACFNFEVELHQLIREKGSLPKEEIAKLMNKHMKAYLGPLFKLAEDDGYFFIWWSHLRNFFYVYSYAFGELVSAALYANYKVDHTFERKISQFMSAGASDSPENIFAGIGIDVRNPQFFQTGLKKIEDDIASLERML